MNKKEMMGAERRQQLLNIGLDQFIRFGYHGTSTRRICDLAGISSGLFFHYFPTKEALYLELVRLGCDGIRPPNQGRQEPLQYFRNEAARIYRVMTADGPSAKMFLFMSAAISAAGDVCKEADEMIRACDPAADAEPVIRRGQAMGQIRPGDARALASVFYGTLRAVAERHSLLPAEALPDPAWVVDLIQAPGYNEGVQERFGDFQPAADQ